MRNMKELTNFLNDNITMTKDVNVTSFKTGLITNFMLHSIILKTLMQSKL